MDENEKDFWKPGPVVRGRIVQETNGMNVVRLSKDGKTHIPHSYKRITPTNRKRLYGLLPLSKDIGFGMHLFPDKLPAPDPERKDNATKEGK